MKKLTLYFTIIGCMQNAIAQSNWTPLQDQFNNYVRDLVVYKGQLIACGSFTSTASKQLKGIAAWDGTQWTALGKGIRYYSYNDNAYANSMTVFNNELYVAGKFDSAGTVASQNIAKWDGHTWTSLNTLGDGSIKKVFAHNNYIYAGGDFTWMQNVQAYNIAKFDGVNWQSVGGGTGQMVYNMCSFQNGLYVIGDFVSVGPPYSPALTAAMWDGTGWHGLGNSQPASYAVIEWQGKLLAANFPGTSGNTAEIRQWDGTNWSVFSQQPKGNLWKFYISNGQLYSSYLSSNSNLLLQDSFTYIWDQNSQTWNKVGTHNQSAMALCEYNGDLYGAGLFNRVPGPTNNYIAKIGIATGIFNENNLGSELKIYPNPVKDKLYVNSNMDGSEIINVMGQTVYRVSGSIQEINLIFLPPGVYYMKNIKGVAIKFIKE